MISNREGYRQRDRDRAREGERKKIRIGRRCCPFLLSILLIRILSAVETPAMLWHTFQLSRSCDHVHTISTAFQIPILPAASIFSIIFYHLFRLIDLVINIIRYYLLSNSCKLNYWTVRDKLFIFYFFSKKKIRCRCKAIFQFQSLYKE